MRLFRSMIFIAFITLMALVYVHQQVEMVKLSYAIEGKENKIKDMLDHKDSLSYNIKNLESPSRLEHVLISKNVNVTFPKKGNVFNVAELNAKANSQGRTLRIGPERANILGFFDFFSSRAEAQAKER